MKSKKFNPAQAKRSLDRLFSLWILHKFNRTCSRCGKQGKCDSCHLIPRQILSLRYSESNVICMCKSCHKFSSTSLHQSPLSFVRWYDSKFSNGNALLSSSLQPFEFTEDFYNETRANLQLSCSINN